MLVATVLTALLFSAIASPPSIPASSFTLEGFTLPANCITITPNCTPTKSDAPTFMAETEKYRPAALVSFIAQSDGECRGAELEMVEGQPAVLPARGGDVETAKGQRAYLQVVFYDADERIQGGADGTQPYKLGVVCKDADENLTWSTFYEAAANSKET